MTKGQIDLKIVGDRIQLIKQSLEDLRALPQSSPEEFTGDRQNPLAADAALRRVLDALFDVGRHILSKRLGIGSLEYRDVAKKLIEHGLVSKEPAVTQLPMMAGYRNRLTHHYDEVTPEELYSIVTTYLGDIEDVSEQIRKAAGQLAHPQDEPL